MASTSSSTSVDERERKRKRADSTPSGGAGAEAQPSKWRTRREHEIYSSKLFEALRLVRGGSTAASPSTAPARGRAVREAADRALAVAARGRTRWSRAILASRRRRLQAAHRARLRAPACPSRHPSAAASASAPGKAPALARKAKVLGRLVPGCQKLPFPALLSEASDYIKALEMQVRAMTALAEVLASVSSSGPASASGSSSSSSSPA
ncbi:transcription factor bHLH148-like [Lolium rigidum]|uniref:transcription factor bHLH148-like n=1 Tax=Lolium rigidum TaxID=89674 RepID=UPI001F5E2AE2|nr:transcription factor bHLH148-like [Lolium rigidum]